METFFFEKTSELKKNLVELEEKLKVKIDIKGKKVSIEGPAFEEYEAGMVMEAMILGFSAKKALSLKNDEMMFVKLPLKSIGKRNNMSQVRARIIGKDGKTKRTLENLANCDIEVSGNEVGIIGEAESMEDVKTGIMSLIKGTKEGNVYGFLEKMNARKRGMAFKPDKAIKEKDNEIAEDSEEE